MSDDAKGLIHNIRHTAKEIKSIVDSLYDRIINGKIKEDEILKRLSIIKFNAEKAEKISKIINRSNFDAEKDEQIVDIVKYIEQYINIYQDIYPKNEIRFLINTNNTSLTKKVSLLDIAVLLDDLISNSYKAKAKNILLELNKPTISSLNIIFSDDGNGVPKIFIDNPEQMFELGVTTTDGSGIGLRSIQMALKSMKGDIKFLGNGIKLNGACFEINIR